MPLDLETPRIWPVKVEIPVAWGDMDAFGHVNNTRYFRYFEDARLAYFVKLGLLELKEAENLGPILKATNCDFLRPVTYPDELTAVARVDGMRQTSFSMVYALWSRSQNEWVAQGSGILVLVNYKTGAKTPIPEAMRNRVAELEAVDTPITSSKLT